MLFVVAWIFAKYYDSFAPTQSRRGEQYELRSVIYKHLVGVILMLVGFLRANLVFGIEHFPIIHVFKKAKIT